MLDEDPEVLFYETQQPFKNKDDKDRYLDFLVKYKNGNKRIIEVKPARRICQFTEQLEDNRTFASKMGYDFVIWTEKELGFANERDATAWADEYLSKIDKVDYVTIRKGRANERSKKSYRKNVATDKVEVFCEYCKTNHTPLRLTYEKNIAKNNGKYICEALGGHLAGSKPKLALRKDNPYASEGKKQCTACKEIKSFELFSPDKSRRDGYCSKCKECRTAEAMKRYNAKKSK